MNQSVIIWNLHIILIRKHRSNYTFVPSCLFMKNSEKVMFPGTGQQLSYTKIWDCPLPILRCFQAAPKTFCPQFSLKSCYMNIFYFILDYFVLYLCFPSYLSVPVLKDVWPHVHGPNLPWNTMFTVLCKNHRHTFRCKEWCKCTKMKLCIVAYTSLKLHHH